MNDQSPGAYLEIICNSCGELMFDMGFWPVQFPKYKDNHNKSVTQAVRYCCRTCRVPSKHIKDGITLGIAIIGRSK